MNVDSFYFFTEGKNYIEFFEISFNLFKILFHKYKSEWKGGGVLHLPPLLCLKDPANM